MTIEHPDPELLRVAREAFSEDLQMKQLTRQNWLKADYINQLMVKVDLQSGAVRPLSGEDYLEAILAPQLDARVPQKIRRLFEVGRGMIAYGYFFYPLFAAGVDQLYRVAEAATRAKVGELGGNTRKRFEEHIDWLAS